MLNLKQGVDILSEVGGVKSIDEAKSIFNEKLDAENLAKLDKIKTEDALLKIANAIKFCKPDTVMISTGSPEEMKKIRQMSIEKGEEAPLALKDHTIHFDLAEEQGRIVDRTFYIINEGEPVSSLGKKILRKEGLAYVKAHMAGIMEGKTMFVGFFSRGPAGAKLSLPAIEISSSTYVMHSADILYRHVYNTEVYCQIHRIGS